MCYIITILILLANKTKTKWIKGYENNLLVVQSKYNCYKSTDCVSSILILDIIPISLCVYIAHDSDMVISFKFRLFYNGLKGLQCLFLQLGLYATLVYGLPILRQMN